MRGIRCYKPTDTQASSYPQYSSSPHWVVAWQLAAGWQVCPSPLTSSLHAVLSGTAEQSELTEQTTRMTRVMTEETWQLYSHHPDSHHLHHRTVPGHSHPHSQSTTDRSWYHLQCSPCIPAHHCSHSWICRPLWQVILAGNTAVIATHHTDRCFLHCRTLHRSRLVCSEKYPGRFCHPLPHSPCTH